jgi:hypothetical protein
MNEAETPVEHIDPAPAASNIVHLVTNVRYILETPK